MRSETAFHKGTRSELIDGDLDLLIDGIQPFNDDLAPLESFVNSLGNFGAITPSSEFIEYHSTEAASLGIWARTRTIPRLCRFLTVFTPRFNTSAT